MKTLFNSIILVLSITATTAKADDFSIEEKGLKPVPKTIDNAIRKTKEVSDECKLIGKSIDLSGQGKKSDFVATTANACDWGASAGPVWVLRNNEVVLSAGTYSIKLNREKTNDLFVIRSSHSSAGVASVEFWSFSGKKYKKTQSYVFTPDDEKTCKAHKDICPWQF